MVVTPFYLPSNLKEGEMQKNCPYCGKIIKEGFGIESLFFGDWFCDEICLNKFIDTAFAV